MAGLPANQRIPRRGIRSQVAGPAPGDLIMCTRNDHHVEAGEPGRTLVNGDLLRLDAITTEGLLVRRSVGADRQSGRRGGPSMPPPPLGKRCLPTTDSKNREAFPARLIAGDWGGGRTSGVRELART